jgi:tetratricopeptide (TPR) repeat protein
MPRWTLLLPLAGLTLACTAGCSTNIERVDPNAPPAAVASGPAPAASPPTTAPEHPAGPAAVLAPPAPAESASAGSAHETRLQQVRALEVAYQKAPGDTGVKAKLIAAKTEYGVKLMEDANVRPMMKYRPALKAFNEVLALDPGNKEAAARKAVIEDIYRSMGRPIPQ